MDDLRGIEEAALSVILGAIEEECRTLPDRLTRVDYPAQRKIYENQARICEEAKPSAYFGVIAEARSGSTNREYFRVGKFGPIYKDGELLVASYFGPIGRMYIEGFEDSSTGYKAAVEVDGNRIISVKLNRADVDAARRENLLKPKTGFLSDIIETIRPDQDELVRKDDDCPVIIHGGPGTGKTVVGLQRLAYLLFNAADGLFEQRVAVIGPSKVYVEYVKSFLSNLGQVATDHFDFHSVCLHFLPENAKDDLQNIRFESHEIRIEKNKPLIDRVIREAIWGEQKEFSLELIFNERGKSPRQIILGRDIVTSILSPAREKFLAGHVNFAAAKSEIGRNLQQSILTTGTTTANTQAGANSQIQRREQRLESWLFRIGLHSQEKRDEWKQILSKPTGGRIRREFDSVLNDFYFADIDQAITEIVELCTMEPGVLRRHLLENGAKRKGSGELEPEESTTEQTDVINIGEFKIEDAESMSRGVIVSQIGNLLNRFMPNTDLLTTASAICSGEHEAFQRLGNPTKSLAKKLSSNAHKSGTGRFKYEWTDADLPIISEINFALTGEVKNYFHVLVDEAQDLSRMESVVISRMVNDRSLTLLGDPNQSTAVAAIADWEGLINIIAPGDEHLRFVLEHNYRVPQDISDYAAQYLPEELRTSIPTCDLDGGIVSIFDTASTEESNSQISALLESRDISERYALITEDTELIDLIAPTDRSNIVLLGPTECKGLEVDHVIVYEPGEWYYEGLIPKKQMYVSLTRATKSVSIIQQNCTENSIFLV